VNEWGAGEKRCGCSGGCMIQRVPVEDERETSANKQETSMNNRLSTFSTTPSEPSGTSMNELSNKER